MTEGENGGGGKVNQISLLFLSSGINTSLSIHVMGKKKEKVIGLEE